MTLQIHAPQIIFIVLTLIGTGIHLAKDGQPKDGKYNFASALFADVLVFALLYWGGFFG